MTFEIELVDVNGMPIALRGLRRPMNRGTPKNGVPKDESFGTPCVEDLRLMRSLVIKGDDHAKFARMLRADVTIRAPRYWWQEMATYRIGVETLSESTMHWKLSEPFEREDFEDESRHNCGLGLEELNKARSYAAKGEVPLMYLKQEIPESFLQTRDLAISYQTLRHIYFAREGHKLPHWQVFRGFIETLPWAEDCITPMRGVTVVRG